MGNRLYMVTFKTVDPLFVIDLSVPANPNILGELKIPGYSDYLHPYDETHIIGFGKDTKSNANGTVTETGMKMAMFDVSNVNNPKEQFSIKIGDMGSTSDVLNDHKALMFLKEENLLAFPVYKRPEYKGLVYTVEKNKFNLKGTIENVGSYYNEKIHRIVYVDGMLYTFSDSQIKQTSVQKMEEVGGLTI